MVRLAALAAVALVGASPAPALSGVRYASVDGAQFGYRVGGSGPALVLIMGRGGTMAEWDPQLLAPLLRAHRVLVFDNRGVATTTNPSTATLTIEQMARDTLALMTKLGIAHADVMGWSMGGMIAQQVALDAPSRVDRLVLCATSPGGAHAESPSPSVQSALDDPNLSTAKLFALSFPPDRAGRRAAIAYGVRVRAQRGLPAASFTITSSARANQEAATAQWKSATGGSYAALPGVRTPTLVLWGSDDVVEPPANDRLIASRIPHARTKVYADAGHAFLFQDAAQVAAAVNAFLQ